MQTIKLISSDKLAKLTKKETDKYLSFIAAGDIQTANDFAESRLANVKRYYNKKDIEAGWLIQPEGKKSLYLDDDQMNEFVLYIQAYNKFVGANS